MAWDSRGKNGDDNNNTKDTRAHTPGAKDRLKHCARLLIGEFLTPFEPSVVKNSLSYSRREKLHRDVYTSLDGIKINTRTVSWAEQHCCSWAAGIEAKGARGFRGREGRGQQRRACALEIFFSELYENY